MIWLSFLKVENLNYYYNKQKPVLQNISFHVEKKEILSILGPSGCGKSTLLKILAGLINPLSGKIYLENNDITILPSQKREIGIVFQSYALFPNLNVYENIAFGLKMKKTSKKAVHERVIKMLTLINLREKAYHFPHQLSGGEQQRVALARALAPFPKLLLLDEPLSALDAMIRKNLRQELHKIIKATNTTSIFVTHDQEEAMLMSDRILVMNEGKIEQEGTPEEIYTKPQTPFVAGFIGNYNLLSHKELQQISQHNLEPNFYAIRPESIKLYPSTDENKFLTFSSSESLICKGQITEVNIAGSIIIYNIKVGSINLRVDRLNHPDTPHLKPGNLVMIEIPHKALQKVS